MLSAEQELFDTIQDLRTTFKTMGAINHERVTISGSPSCPLTMTVERFDCAGNTYKGSVDTNSSTGDYETHDTVRREYYSAIRTSAGQYSTETVLSLPLAGRLVPQATMTREFCTKVLETDSNAIATIMETALKHPSPLHGTRTDMLGLESLLLHIGKPPGGLPEIPDRVTTIFHKTYLPAGTRPDTIELGGPISSFTVPKTTITYRLASAETHDIPGESKVPAELASLVVKTHLKDCTVITSDSPENALDMIAPVAATFEAYRKAYAEIVTDENVVLGGLANLGRNN